MKKICLALAAGTLLTLPAQGSFFQLGEYYFKGGVSASTKTDIELHSAASDYDENYDLGKPQGLYMGAGYDLGLFRGDVDVQMMHSNEVENYGVFANAYIDLPIVLFLEGFVGVGLGILSTDISRFNHSTEISYKGQLGVLAHITPKLKVELSYSGTNASSFFEGRDLDFSTSNLNLGLRYVF